MKDIKTFVIGFLTCACMFLIMGQTDGKKSKHYDTYLEVEKGNVTIEANENGRYQAFSYAKFIVNMIDTKTGEVFLLRERSEKKGGNYWQQTLFNPVLPE